MKTFIIGDIHGCSGQFDTLLNKLHPDPETDRIVLLGDLFDRGPSSWEVFQMVKELQASYKNRFILILGNHEDYLMQKKLSLVQRIVWERVGRHATVRSFAEHGEKMEDSALWIGNHSVLFWKGEGYTCVHAGMRVYPPEVNDVNTLVHDHGIVLENQYNGPLAVTGHIALDEPAWFAGDGETIVKPEKNVWHPLPENGTLCIDAGCGKGGRLVGMTVEDGRYMLTSAE